MSDRPQGPVYSYVERAYIRLEAGDVLVRCFEEEATTPIQELVESLVLAGPQNMATIREILEETEQRTIQLQDDLHQVFSQLRHVLADHGVHLGEEESSRTIGAWSTDQLLELMQYQGVNKPATQAALNLVWEDSRDIMDNLQMKLRLLREVEAYLQDWLWGLAYQTIRRQEDPDLPDIVESPL